jgi:HYR domain
MLVFAKLSALLAVLALFVVPVAQAATTDTATAEASPGPYLVGQPITFTSTTPCTVSCRLTWKYLNGTRLGDQLGEGVSVQTAFSTPGPQTVQLRLSEQCVGTSRLVCSSFAEVTVDVADVQQPPDTTPPTISAAGLEVEATGPLTVVDYSVGATDPDDTVISVACSPARGQAFPLGTTPIDCTAVDSNGNVGTATFDVVVSDTTGPAVTAPAASLAAEATSPDGAAVTFDVSATDLVDGAVPATCSLPSGATFPLGSTFVTCTAVDAHGNGGLARFEVVVSDHTGPAVTVPDAVASEATSADGAAVTFDASASDLVDGAVPATCSPESGSTFALGATTVTCSATDSRGNTGSANFVVHVGDTTAPTLTAPASVVANATWKGGATVTFDVAAVDAAGGDVATACAPASGSQFAVGTTTVTCTASDARGNTATGSFDVEVKGAVVQLEDLLAAVTSWHVPGHLIEIRTKGPHWSLTQTPPRVNLACQQIGEFETALDGTLGAPLTPERLAWLLGELGRISGAVGCAPAAT